MYVYYNANPAGLKVGDCTVRAISKATSKSWMEVYIDLCVLGLCLHDMPSANCVWGEYLDRCGFKKKMGEMQTVRNFAKTHKNGVYILALSGHVVALVNGDYFDTWDSGDNAVMYYWEV